MRCSGSMASHRSVIDGRYRHLEVFGVCERSGRVMHEVVEMREIPT
jgi:hypothetical protein